MTERMVLGEVNGNFCAKFSPPGVSALSNDSRIIDANTDVSINEIVQSGSVNINLPFVETYDPGTGTVYDWYYCCPPNYAYTDSNQSRFRAASGAPREGNGAIPIINQGFVPQTFVNIIFNYGANKFSAQFPFSETGEFQNGGSLIPFNGVYFACFGIHITASSIEVFAAMEQISTFATLSQPLVTCNYAVLDRPRL